LLIVLLKKTVKLYITKTMNKSNEQPFFATKFQTLLQIGQ